MKIPKFMEPSPEQKAESLRQMKVALGVSDEEKYALYTLLLWLLNGMHCDHFHDAIASDPELMESYHVILKRHHQLEGSR